MRNETGVMEGPPGAETVVDGKRYLYFGGTGYFGLHGHPEVIRAGVAAFRAFGTHGATSRAGFGNNPVLLRVEALLREYFGTAEAAYFGSGYLSILILTRVLADDFDAIFADEWAHYCIGDAAPAAGKPVFLFRHRDPEDLALKLRRKLRPGGRPLLLTDGVFPVSGRIAPLREYRDALATYGGLMAVDDAHGAGVLGRHGRGVIEHLGIKSGAVHLAGTLSKAFGGHGGFIVGGKMLISRVRTRAGAYVGSTPPPTSIAAASAKGIELLLAHPQWRDHLRANVALAKRALRKLGIDTDDTPVPIIAWSLRTSAEMRKIQRALLDRGVAIAYLKYAGAPPQGVLRVAIFSTHTAGQIERLAEELGRTI
jgi:8-amino-7-oxononanoate synthase